MKFTILPKEVLVRGYFVLKALFLQMEDRYINRDYDGTFDRAYLAFVISCVHLARRIGRRVRYPWRLAKVARKVVRNAIAP